MTKVTLPTPETNPGAAEWAEVFANDRALREVVNGSIDSENIKKEGIEGPSLKKGTVDDERLVSPNNAVYREIHIAGGLSIESMKAAKYFFGGTTIVESGTDLMAISSNPSSRLVYLRSTDFAVAGKTTKLRVVGSVLSNGTKLGITLTFSLFPLTVAGGVGALTYTLGVAVAGSSVKVENPPASTVTAQAGSEFSIPADGAYVLGLEASGAKPANSAALFVAQLQLHHS